MNKRTPLLFFFYFIFQLGMAQPKTAQEFQDELNKEYADSSKTPLLMEDWAKFEGLPFYPIDSTFIVLAQFKRTPNSEPFEMQTTTDRLPVYEKYGEAYFSINGKEFVLNIYQGHKTREMEAYKNHLFLPFTDETNGNETYGGGRFIDLLIPENDQLMIDFNQAYNPLCAYNHNYSCPIPPKENFLSIKIEAGVKYEGH